jgi:hypothetical protein
MKLEISIGEYIDRFTILEIKKDKILQEERKKEILIELSHYSEAEEICAFKCKIEYKLLKYINTRIWNLTNMIKSIDSNHSEFSMTAQLIFEFNQSRFRVKNQINHKFDCLIKEQKSYSDNFIVINIDKSQCENIVNLVEFIYYVSIYFDKVFLITNRQDLIVEFKTPNYVILNHKTSDKKNVFTIEDLLIKYPYDQLYTNTD